MNDQDDQADKSRTSTIEDQNRPGSSTSRRPSPLARHALAAALFLGFAKGLELESATTVPYRRKEVAESSTSDYEVDHEVTKEMLEVFRRGSEELFMDGYSSDFSRSLTKLIRKYGNSTVKIIANHILTGSASPDVISEALKWLSDFTEASTLSLRWHLLERTLRHPSPVVRDGAILGFAAIDDQRAVSLLAPRRENEPIKELRVLIDQVIQQLQRSR